MKSFFKKKNFIFNHNNLKTLGAQRFSKEAFERLTSRDPAKFWTSGQWMTEKRGGSDVGK